MAYVESRPVSGDHGFSIHETPASFHQPWADLIIFGLSNNKATLTNILNEVVKGQKNIGGVRQSTFGFYSYPGIVLFQPSDNRVTALADFFHSEESGISYLINQDISFSFHKISKDGTMVEDRSIVYKYDESGNIVSMNILDSIRNIGVNSMATRHLSMSKVGKDMSLEDRMTVITCLDIPSGIDVIEYYGEMKKDYRIQTDIVAYKYKSSAGSKEYNITAKEWEVGCLEWQYGDWSKISTQTRRYSDANNQDQYPADWLISRFPPDNSLKELVA